MATGLNSEHDRSLNSKQAADFLTVSPRTLESWRLRRVGPPFIKLSARAVRYSSAALRQWRDAQTVVCD
jgi:hypothetical protein